MGGYGNAYYANYGAPSHQYQGQPQQRQQYGGGASSYGHGQYGGAQY